MLERGSAEAVVPSIENGPKAFGNYTRQGGCTLSINRGSETSYPMTVSDLDGLLMASVS